MTTSTRMPRRRVRVWFGKTPIADYTNDADLAAKYETAMRRRFEGLRVTSEPVGLAEEPSTT